MQEKDPKMQQSDLDSEITSEITFLQEKIKERPVNRKKLARRTAITVVMAMVFGLVACVTFLLLEPVINRMLYPEEKAEIVRFPEEEEEVRPEDMQTAKQTEMIPQHRPESQKAMKIPARQAKRTAMERQGQQGRILEIQPITLQIMRETEQFPRCLRRRRPKPFWWKITRRCTMFWENCAGKWRRALSL